MNDYNELIERCKEICDWQDTGLLKGDALRNFAASRPYAQQHNSVSIAQAETLREVADAFLVMAARVAELEAARIAYASEFPPDAEGLPDTGRIHANICAMKVRVAELKSRLEISPLHNVDGIMARDATIKLQDGRIAELEANRADLAKQALVAWDSGEEWEPLALCLCAEENGLDSCHELIWEGYPPEPWGERWQKYEREAKRMIDLVSQYAAPPVITQHEPVTTVEDRYNADGKSCHITDDLPAGMKLYADPPVAAPVRPNDSELEMIARAHGTGGWQTLGDMVTFARAIESAVLRANGFKLEGEQ